MTAAQPIPDPKQFAAVLIRGPVHVDHEVLDTLCFLRLHKKHTCAILANTPSTKGMLERCKSYITWGEIAPETLTALIKARGKTQKASETGKAALPSKERLPHSNKEASSQRGTDSSSPHHQQGYHHQQFFHLHPPRGGFERKGIKAPFSIGGSLGYRGNAINALIERML